MPQKEGDGELKTKSNFNLTSRQIYRLCLGDRDKLFVRHRNVIIISHRHRQIYHRSFSALIINQLLPSFRLLQKVEQPTKDEKQSEEAEKPRKCLKSFH